MSIIASLVKKTKKETVETIKEDISIHLKENGTTYKIAATSLVVGVAIGAAIFRRPQIVQHFHVVTGSLK